MYIHEQNKESPQANQFNKALFLDRDGVLIEYFPYLSHPDQVKVPYNAKETFKKWQNYGYILIVVTNQSGVSRGYFTLDDVHMVNEKIRQEYESFGVHFHDIFICPHQPSDNCKCRKPSPQMLLEAANKHCIDLSQSFFIGDAISDVECAINAGCQPILLLTDRTSAFTKQLAQMQVMIHTVHELPKTLKLIQAN